MREGQSRVRPGARSRRPCLRARVVVCPGVVSGHRRALGARHDVADGPGCRHGYPGARRAPLQLRGQGERRLAERDPGYGPRPERLRLIVAGYIGAGGLLIALAALGLT